MSLDEVLRKHGIDPSKVVCGASCGDGWASLIDELITDLVALGWDKDLHQLKEKFGGLRFCVGTYDARIDARISRAEHESWRVCEQCGAAGKRRGGGWIETLCDGCDAARRPS